ncbi:MAG TPA: serine/threonine-protein kinase [Polyangium sp.]|nr:serine/threonine-protein kinase [Polyangium sp.]
MSSHPDRIGPYEISRLVGEGGFGQVFEAVQEHTRQRVAVKVLFPEKAGDRETVKRFIQEGKALETLKDHPGVVRVMRSGETDDGRPYFAMEFLEGLTLRKWFVERDHRVSLELALTLGQQIASIMTDVHDRNLVHRDLKPENIMLVDDKHVRFGQRPIVLDFGIAKVTRQLPFDEHATTRIKTDGIGVIGTKGYMAPEQFGDTNNATAKTDVYVLGLVMFELLSGKPPFQADDEVELALMHNQTIAPNLQDLVPTVPPLLATFIAAMLAKKPEDRPWMSNCRDMFARDWTQASFACPFPGLQAFDDSRAHLFFGRRRETEQLHEKLVEVRPGQTFRWLEIQGPSGVGKSSLVHAALLPDVVRAKQWFVVTLHLTEDPVRSLGHAFAAAYGENAPEVVAAFRKNPNALDDFLKEHHTLKTNVLLVLDPFEELFALGGAGVSHFGLLLSNALDNPESPLRLLTTIRNDYVHRLDGVAELATSRERHVWRYVLPPMDEASLVEVVEGMASLGGLQFENGLAEKMVHDATGNDYRLPLLGHTLRSLWPLRARGEITHEQYKKMGGVGGALAKQAGDLLESLDEAARERAKWLILALVQVGQGAPDTRRMRTRAEVTRAAGEDAPTEKAWGRLSGDTNEKTNGEFFRLLITSGDASDPTRQRVELVHEMVLHKVRIVSEWIHAERKFLELLAALESAALEWHRSELGKPKDGLPTGSLLNHYQGGQDAPRRERLRLMVSAGARDYLDEAERLEQRQRRRLMGIATVMIAAVVAIVVFAVLAVRARNEADRNLIEAVRARYQADQNLEAMLDTTDNTISSVDWPMGRIGHTLPLRRMILTPQHEQLLRLEKEDPNRLRIRVIDSLQRLSDLERQDGTVAQAEAHVNAAEKRIAAGLMLDPNANDLKALWAWNLSKRGKVYLLREQNKEALKDFDDSIRELDPLLGKSAYADEQTLATSYIEKGDALAALGQLEAAGKSYTRGLDLRRELVNTAKPDNRSYRRALLAQSLALRARVPSDSAVAMHDLNEAQTIALDLVAQEEHNLLYQSILGTTYLRIADINLAANDWAGAQVSYQFAETVSALLMKSAPEHKDYAMLRIDALMGLESILRQTSDSSFDQADAYRQQWRELAQSFVQKDPQDQRFRRLLLK